MKKWMAMGLAAALLLPLAACKKEETAPAAPEEPPAAAEPETPETPEVPETPEGTDSPESPAPPEQAPEAGTAAVADAVSEGSIEELVSYRFRMPEVTAENAEAAQILNDYYTSVSGMLGDLCYGEG